MPIATLNCDMGESFGIYSFGCDEELVEHIDVANIACGFHGSDFNHMRSSVQLAKRSDISVGAHPSLPDLQGFGRREMAISRDELANCIIYQIGALSGFLQAEGVKLSHIKPHGALYGMAAKDAEIAHAVADAADVFDVPLFGLPGTKHEEIYRQRGHSFVCEFFADLDYSDDGELIITRKHAALDPRIAAERARDAVRYGIKSPSAKSSETIRPETICIHSDTPNAVEIAKAVSAALKETENND